MGYAACRLMRRRKRQPPRAPRMPRRSRSARTSAAADYARMRDFFASKKFDCRHFSASPFYYAAMTMISQDDIFRDDG